jgi:hypothetical protein
VGFDYKTYDQFTTLAWKKLEETTSQVQTFDKKSADSLRNQQDTALKILLEDLNKKGNDKLSRQFEHEFYGQWQKKFDHQYEKSLTDNDWAWLTKPV